jgi:hypothetical protein
MSCDSGRGGLGPPNMRDTVSFSPRGGAASWEVREPRVFLAWRRALFPKSTQARPFCRQEARLVGAFWERRKWMMNVPR